MLWNLECHVGLSQKDKYVRISVKEIWHNFDCLPKGKKLREWYVSGIIR